MAHGSGCVNPDWDNEFLDLLETDPEPLAALSHHDYMERGGTEVGRDDQLAADAGGAWWHGATRMHRNYHAPLITGYGLLALEADKRHGHPHRRAPISQSLRDDRQIWIDGERVRDVITDRRFAGAAHSVAELYDMQHDPALLERMTYRLAE